MPHAADRVPPRHRLRRRLTLPGLAARLAAVPAPALAVLLVPAGRLAAQVRVTGRVTAAGSPVSDVTVRVKGTTLGARTDTSGRYAVVARTPNDTLTFARIGYAAQQVPLAGRTVVDVQLTAAARNLQEVVTIGYGAKSRANLTESVGTVSATEIEQQPIATPEQAIQGRVSGVQVTSQSGIPGGGLAVRIRGVGTVGNTQPLFVVDGIPVGRGSGDNDLTNPLATLNPNDIESLSVLKDASAAAVYGVQAANGVVLITTRRGRLGKPTITYDAYAGVQHTPPLWQMNNTQAYVALVQAADSAYNAQNNLKPGDKSYLTLNKDLQPGSPLLARNTDWLGNVVRQNAPITNQTLSVSGATNQLSYFVSGGYFGQSAVIDKWDLNRMSFRANTDYRINTGLHVGENLTLSYERVTRGVGVGGDGFLLRNAAQMPPFFRIYDTDRRVANNRYGYDGNLNVAGLSIANENGINQVVTYRDRLGRVLGSLFGEQSVFHNRLTLRSQASVDVQGLFNEGWSPGYTAQELGLDRTTTEYDDGRGYNTSLVWTNTATYAGSVGGHNFNVLGGVETQQYRGSVVNAIGQGFLSSDRNYYTVVSNASTVSLSNGGAYNTAFLGFLGRLSYDYRDRYLATFSVRRDGTSTFSPQDGRRWGTFPAVSAGWRISQEPFWHSSVVSDLKLRGSLGALGNSAIAIQYPYLVQVTTDPQYGLNGSTTVKAPSPANFANPNLTWETVRTGDVGIEGSLFRNAVDFSATYYRRTTRNFLVLVPISSVTGFTSAPVNAGSVLNRGVELELGYRTRLPRGVDLNLSGNLTTVSNRLVALAPGLREYTAGGPYRTAVGYPIGYLYGYKTNGLYQTPAEAAAAPPDKTTNAAPQPGDIRFVDVNGDGKVTADDRTYLGKTIPDFFYGLTAGLTYRNFGVTALFQGVQGVQLYNEFRQVTEDMTGAGRNDLATTQHRWTGPGTSTTMPRAVANDPNQNARISDRFVENGSYLRLKNLQLAYTLPGRVVGNRVRSARLTLTGTNLLTFTKYSGLDPEVRTFGSSTSQTAAGTDQGNIPQPRFYQVGLTLGF